MKNSVSNNFKRNKKNHKQLKKQEKYKRDLEAFDKFNNQLDDIAEKMIGPYWVAYTNVKIDQFLNFLTPKK